jgi:hypothetical protein
VGDCKHDLGNRNTHRELAAVVELAGERHRLIAEDVHEAQNGNTCV